MKTCQAAISGCHSSENKMAHIITNDRGESIDIDTAEGQYRYVANALVQHGVHSQILGALAALYRDGQRIDWLADKGNSVGQVLLPRAIVERNLTSMRAAIDAAMSMQAL